MSPRWPRAARSGGAAVMVAREPLVLAGVGVAEAVFRKVSSALQIDRLAQDRQSLKRGDPILRITGSAAATLTAERVALNFVQRLSGVATLTAQFVAAIKVTRHLHRGHRKTTPGLRTLEKYAVTCGGAQNHRHGLFDMVLIKDNHLAAFARKSRRRLPRRWPGPGRGIQNCRSRSKPIRSNRWSRFSRPAG